MDLQVDNETICLLTKQDKEMLGEDDLIQKVYLIAVTAFMEGMKFTKDKERE